MLPYRIRQVLRRLCIAALVLILVASVMLLCWFFWLNRYVIYTQDGVKLDFSLDLNYPEGELAVPPATSPSVPIHYTDGSGDQKNDQALQQLRGYYVELSLFKEDISTLRSQIEALPDGTPILLDMKSIRGDFYYTSSIGKLATDTDLAQIDSLISQLKEDHYLIARIPAFRDYWFGLDNVPYGLPKAGGNGSLWMDEDRCYWLNPASDGALSYLIRIVTELRSLGFDEVVFSDFRFPDTDAIQFDGDRLETLNQAAAALVKGCATDTFAVSFIRHSADLTLPEGRTRLYLDSIEAADATTLADQVNAADPNTQVVFLTPLNDTRFDEFSVLRPISMAH